MSRQRGERLSRERQKSEIEAILFAMGEAVDADRLAKAMEISVSEVMELVYEMKAAYESEERGIQIIELEGAFQLCTKKEHYDCLIRIAKQPKKTALTDVVLETLSIIAYKQPITKIELEKIRGVKCDHAVNRLIEYGLVKEVGRLDAPGRPLLFGTTEEFLRNFGVQSLAELPAVNPVKLADFKAEAEEEVELTLKL
ncbi:MAG: SMC-Scp complex subunit ScpB [Eubacteriales bacterium]|nr:SMC-Scp complex subunit ScpB [Eubacteriales bacterium]